MRISKTLIDTHNFESKVIALSTMRPLSEQEITFYSNTPAKDAVFEFEAIASGLSTTFDIRSYTEETERKDNYNLNWTIRKYSEKYGNNDIYAISAPSSEPDIRRANSVGALTFFKRLNVLPHSNIINCTSQIYCHISKFELCHFAIKHTVNFDTVGYIQIRILQVPRSY